MAILTDQDRRLLWAEFMSETSRNRTSLSLTKDDLRAAVNAIDDWVDLNAVSFNLAIPLPARTALTARQKAQFLMYVVRRRFEVA